MYVVLMLRYSIGSCGCLLLYSHGGPGPSSCFVPAQVLHVGKWWYSLGFFWYLVMVQIRYLLGCSSLCGYCVLYKRRPPVFAAILRLLPFPSPNITLSPTMSGFFMTPGAPVHSDVVAPLRDPVTNLLVLPLPQRLTATQASFVVSHSAFYTVMR
jgi:hypothetical protein